jgi:hypothetical protein
MRSVCSLTLRASSSVASMLDAARCVACAMASAPSAIGALGLPGIGSREMRATSP